nr:hypothetical protein [uncultured Chryseobacterium sp.]
MKKVIFVLAFTLSITGCSQNQQSTINNQQPMYDIDQYIFPEAKDITEANFVEKLNSQIKHYNSEPIYYFRTNKRNCLIEIYVNDVSLFDDYDLSNYITPTPLSSLFLKSGEQKVTVKMYPIGNLNNESLGVKDAVPVTKLTEESQVMISIISIDEKSNKGLDDEQLITQKVSPKEVAGRAYYEFSFTFDAKVPFEFEGWKKGQNLQKLDQELVRKKALEFYNMVGQMYLNKDLDAQLKIDFPSTVRIKGSYYRDKQNLTETLAEYKDDITGNNYTLETIKDYRIEYMGEGRLLRLITNSKDPDLRNGGALFLKYGKGGIFVPPITLYLPEGRNLATQGFMMWK